ncbi:MAG TPA: aldo/keto reductase [Sphingobacteriaceae bacterium]
MRYRSLGKSDLQVSEISFGCMSLKPGSPDNGTILHRAIELGVNLFDTADLYDKGENEALIGKALKAYRNRIILATKVGNRWRADGSGWDWIPRKEHILTSVEGSLRRLQTEYIDLYQLHGGTIDDPVDEVLEAFEMLRDQGKIRYYGISSIRPNVIREYVKRSNIVSVMTQYSLLDRRPEEFTLDYLKENTIGVLARGGLAQGLLIDKPLRPYLEQPEKDIEKAVKGLHFVAEEKEPTAIALNFVLEHPAISSAVVGIRTEEHLQAAVQTMHWRLSDFELNFLRDSIKQNSYAEHR